MYLRIITIPNDTSTLFVYHVLTSYLRTYVYK